MTCRKPHFQKTLWALGLVASLGLSLVVWRADAGSHGAPARTGLSRQGEAELPRAGAAEALAAILNPDGTLRANRNGSYDVSGYRMEYAAGGAPRFVPAAQAGCNGWDTQFHLPNGTDTTVRSLAVIGSDIYVGGDFSVVGNLAANRVARFNTTTNTWSTLGSGAGNGVNSSVIALLASGSNLYVGGVFTQANVGGAVVNANFVAKFDTTTNTWSALSSGTGNGVNSQVNALAVSGSDLYVGGLFSQANVGAAPISASRVAKFDTTTGAWSALAGGVSGGVDDRVYALAVIGSDVYVGGDFTQADVGGTPVSVNYVARFDTTSSTWSKLGTGAGNGVGSDSSRPQVFALAVIGNDLYVGGYFTQANVGGTPVSVNHVARFNTTTSAWSALDSGTGNGVNSAVNVLMVSGSDLYVGGYFTQANAGVAPISANRVARFNTTTGAWSAFGAGAGNGVNNAVLGLAVMGSNLYVGGVFNQANVGGTVVSVNNVAQFNTTTNTWAGLSSGTGNGVNGYVDALAVMGSDLYVGGDFTLAGSVAASRVAKFDTTTNTWSALGAGAGNGVNGQVNALAVSGSNLYVGGQFSQANVGGTPVSVNHVAKFDTTTNTWSGLGSGMGNGVNGYVGALLVSGSDLYVGGGFTEANVGGTPVSVNKVARFDTTTNTWSKLGTGAGNGVGNGGVGTLAMMGSDLYVGGFFTQANVGGTVVSVNNIARFNTTTDTWSGLGPDVSTNNYGVFALAVLGDDLYVGGRIGDVGEGPDPVPGAHNVERYNTTTGTWSTLGGTPAANGVNGIVNALAVIGSDIYVGGEFFAANFGGTPVIASRVAKFDTTTDTWSALLDPGGGNGVNSGSSQTSTIVYALAARGSDLYVGGKFALAGDNKPSLNIGRFCICDAVLSQTSESFAANVSAETFTVQIDAACAWTAVSNDPFITINAPVGTVTGPGTVSYTVAAHSGSSPRSGTISVAGQTFTVLQGVLFNDVPSDQLFYHEIGKLSARGVTLGCGGGNYCPESFVTRDQMAAFLSRALGVPNPPTPGSQRFADVPPSHPFYAFIEEMAVRQITLGCGDGNYCPTAAVTREQMAAFIIRALHEPGYVPPTPGSQRFADVPPTHPFYAHIEEMAVLGITQGCGGGNYCPTANVTRRQMAAFLVRAFNL